MDPTYIRAYLCRAEAYHKLKMVSIVVPHYTPPPTQPHTLFGKVGQLVLIFVEIVVDILIIIHAYLFFDYFFLFK